LFGKEKATLVNTSYIVSVTERLGTS